MGLVDKFPLGKYVLGGPIGPADSLSSLGDGQSFKT